MRPVLLLRIAALCLLGALVLADTGTAQGKTSAEQAHRPADGIRGFAAACLPVNVSLDSAKAAFRAFDLAPGISNRPTGQFPAGAYGGYPAGMPGGAIETSCRVRIRGHWLSSADPFITEALRRGGYQRLASRQGTEVKRGARIEYGAASGVYRQGRRSFLVLISQTKQPAGRTTELFIGRLRG